MRVLVIGSGGRENALVWKLAQSARVKKIYVAPGNPGMREYAELVDKSADDKKGLLQFCLEQNIDLCVVGPEAPLALGIVDDFKAKGIAILGPDQFAAQLESSKSFAKKLMKEADIPTARFEVFTDQGEAKHFAHNVDWQTGLVIKASGLAQGKGVIVCDDRDQAAEAVELLMGSSSYGVQAPEIVIEERLGGREVSAFFLCDGNDGRFLGLAQDHKRLLDRDMGPNTGGMGAFSPVEWCPPNFALQLLEKVVTPVLKKMKEKGHPFCGVLFIGLMVGREGFQVLEFNTRFGDPETQVLLPLLDEDLADWFMAAATGELSSRPFELKHHPGFCVHVVKAAKGYPGVKGEEVKKGNALQFTEGLTEGVLSFFSGVQEKNKKLVTSGGRVFGMSALGASLEEARGLCYQNLPKISFKGEQYRSDIAE